MDYKLIRRTIAVCSLSVLAILVIVLWSNRYGNPGQQTYAGADQADKALQEGAGGADTPGGPSSGGQTSDGGGFSLSGDTRAFLQDEDFWDDEPEYEWLTDSDAVRLSLIATSRQHDLRLQIVDPDGNLVTGQPFFVKIEEVGEFKDLDQDGVVYVRDLNAGDYHVSIEPIEGYHVAASYTKVHVNDRVEYKVIEDIHLLIVSEDEIDVQSEALQGHDLADDRDDTERTSTFEGLDEAVMGIDVSSFNRVIDWERVKAAGIEFAIIRCGYRGYTSGALVEDAKFIENITGANEAGVRVGVYFFTQAVSEVEAVEEASMVATLCRDYQVDLPVFIDTESTGGNGRADGLDVETRTLVCRAFCETMESAGYRAGVYASKNWILERLDYDKLDKYLTWLAEYKEQPTYEGKYQFWQYTSNGWIDGVIGRVDLDIGNLSFSALGEILQVDYGEDDNETGLDTIPQFLPESGSQENDSGGDGGAGSQENDTGGDGGAGSQENDAGGDGSAES